ncbi:MAG TPA: AarF/UbiB family protein [Roseiflexaceae bacterium]|nr:AarF/UbiB family protein [Roseiflexaceae bacterium]
MQTITNAPTELSPAPPKDKLPPLNIHSRRRFLRISWFFLSVIARVFLFDILLGRWSITRWYVRRTAMQRWVRIARGFRGLAAQMGGVLIKLGQFLSARADILPIQITDELAGLQDEVPPAPLPYILITIVEELGAAPAELFAQFVPTPVAAASLGQVFFGRLHDGRDVAIKVQRPRIDEIVEIDLRAVEWAVRVIRNYGPIKRRADLLALFEEFKRVLIEELDYIQEARNAQIIRANFADVPGVYIPEPYPEISSRRVLIMERIGGIKVSDIAALDRAGVDRSELAHRFYAAYLKQWFLDGVFHADPHPGNLFVRVDGPPQTSMADSATEDTEGKEKRIESGPSMPSVNSVAKEPAMNHSRANGTRPGAPCTLIFVDFGMVGRLGPRAMTALRESTVAIATNDPERFVMALDNLGVILPGADRRPIIQAANVLFRHTYDRSISELSNIDVEGVFGEVESLVRDMPFQVPQDLIYLGRSVGMVSGMTTALDPHINLFETLRPFAQQLMARESREGDWFGRARTELTSLGQILATLPRQMDSYYKAANRGDLQIRVDLSRLERGMRRVERATSRLAGGIMASGLFIGGVLLRINGFETETRWVWAAAVLAVLWTIWPRRDR